MAAGVGAADDESAVKTAPPPSDCRAVNRLLEQCTRPTGPAAEARPGARDRLDTILGGELARRLVGALAGDHAAPVRAFGN
jgi:hypothetical protein